MDSILDLCTMQEVCVQYKKLPAITTAEHSIDTINNADNLRPIIETYLQANS